MLQAGPGCLVFITAYRGRSNQCQLNTENSLDRGLERKHVQFFPFFWAHLFGAGSKKKPGFHHISIQQCHYLLKWQWSFHLLSFPYQNRNLSTQNILRFSIYREETDSWTRRIDLWVPRGEQEGSGMDGEFGVGRCKLLYLEWLSNKVLLYSTGNYVQSLGTEHDGR